MTSAAMALGAVEFLVYGLAAANRFGRVRRLRRNGNRRFGLLGGKAGREGLDVGDDIEPLAVASMK